MSDFGPKPENPKTIEKQMKFYVFWVQTGDGAMRQMRRCHNKSVKIQLFVIAFSEIDAVKRHIVERVFICQKSNILGPPRTENKLSCNMFCVVDFL